jgi:hypothetical protein
MWEAVWPCDERLTSGTNSRSKSISQHGESDAIAFLDYRIIIVHVKGAA